MPIWLRKFTYDNLLDHYNKEREAQEKANKKVTTAPQGPDISPTYNTKASTK